MISTLAAFLVGIASSVAAAWLLTSTGRIRRRVTFRTILREVRDMHDQIAADGYTPDYIVTIDRNSGIVGSILSGEFGLAAVVSVSTVNRRQADGTREIHIDPVHLGAMKKLRGKRVLVLICCNDSGTSLRHVVDCLAAEPSPPSEIRTAAIFSSPSPGFRPTYVGAVAGQDFKLTMPQLLERLPWVDADWKLQLATERHVKPAGPRT